MLPGLPKEGSLKLLYRATSQSCFALSYTLLSLVDSELNSVQFWHISEIQLEFYFLCNEGLCSIFLSICTLRSICKYRQGNSVYTTIGTDLVHASSSAPTSRTQTHCVVCLLMLLSFSYFFLPETKRCQKQELIFSCTKRK